LICVNAGLRPESKMATSLDEETPMASTRINSAEVARHSPAESPDDPTSLVDAIFEAQRVQWEALLSWQESLATCAKDCWEQWAVRYAGGMPFDG
jgi:predicted Abi (CAAX) family protease